MTPSAPSTTQRQLESWLGENIPRYMAESKMPGFSIAVVQDGQTIYADGFGARDPERNLPVTADTLFGIGSITKSFVAIGILQLVEAGQINLHDAVADHIPCQLGTLDAPITIHHLLTHTLGVPSLASSTVAIYRGLGMDRGIPFSSVHDFYRFVNGAQDEVVAKPGERFFYHNAGWRMLGHIIQEKAGIPFTEYIRGKIIEPLGMERTTFDSDHFQADPDHAVFHHKTAAGGNEAAPFPYPNPADNLGFSFLAAAGGLCSSANEMAEYVQAQIELGRHNSHQLASSDSFKAMQTLHIETPPHLLTTEGDFAQDGYGYGLAITPRFLGQKMVSHGGSVLVSTAHMALIPERKVGVVMMGNSAGMDYSTIAHSVLAILLGQTPEAVIPALKIEGRMNQLMGTYNTYQGIETINVVNQGGMLYLKESDALTLETTLTPLIPEDPMLESTHFTILNSGTKSPVEFIVEEDGATTLLVERYAYRKRG